MSRVFGFVSVVLVLGLGLYIYSKQLQSAAAPGEASRPRSTIDLIGVKGDLINIANAERQYLATEGRYASLDELVSSNTIALVRQRPPYTYKVQIESGGFRVVATPSGEAVPGAPAQLYVDQNMNFHASED